MDLLNIQAPVEVDIALAFLSFVAAVVQWCQIVWNQQEKKVTARTMIAFGWSMWATRLWYAILVEGDPVIPPIAAMALGLVACGNILRNLPSIRKK